MSEFAVPLADIDHRGTKEKTFVVRSEWIRGALEDTETTTSGQDGSLRLRLSRTGDDVVAVGELKATVSMPCARCLEPSVQTIDARISCLLVPTAKIKTTKPGASDEESELEFDESEADTVPYDGEMLVFDGLVRDELLLETPMIPLCSEDCPGMRGTPVKGDEDRDSRDSIDPRLAVLKSITLK